MLALEARAILHYLTSRSIQRSYQAPEDECYLIQSRKCAAGQPRAWPGLHTESPTFSDLHTSNALNAEQFSDSANKREMSPAPKSFVYKMGSIVEMSAEALPARTKLKRMTTKDRGRFVQGTKVKLSTCTHKESGMVTYVSIWPLFVACKPV